MVAEAKRIRRPRPSQEAKIIISCQRRDRSAEADHSKETAHSNQRRLLPIGRENTAKLSGIGRTIPGFTADTVISLVPVLLKQERWKN